jgi:hypothetical protein
MTAIVELLRHGQGAELARLQLKLELAVSPPPAAEPTPAVYPTCGRLRPVPAATFRAIAEALTSTARPGEG